MFQTMLIAGAGGFVGTCCRFWVNKLSAIFSAGPFPWATFIVNIVGCFLFGAFLGWLEKNNCLTPNMRALLLVGFCGGFTTFSTFSDELFQMSSLNEWLWFAVYLILSVVLGILFVWLGRSVSA